ncbi:hypothetical protein [Mycobacterium sp. 852014-52144_SCH5372336]|uniref:hypothetical protein n=1 Tax=Mycobacterium sp. 852014-52144_SCH5372336 TaxID=1834115 RepID=UPI000800D567|nr:hypothetical protein [Mycobacterium sp. 852014-52144_SCH5372336]OBB73742.1 hypothetical protein A5759_15190 [Mycobacterium sp. 852014-52144_SCH5372336]
MRLTAGVCVLAAGLLFGGGGAVASADDSGSTGGAGTSGSTGTSQGSTTGTDGSGSSGATTGTATKSTPKIDRRFRLRLPDFSRQSPSRKDGFTRPTTIVRGGVDTTATTGTKADAGVTGDEESAADEANAAPANPQGTELGVGAQTTESGTVPETQELTTETEPAAEAPVSTAPADGSATQPDSNSAADDAAASPAPQTGTTPAVQVNTPVTPEAKTTDPLTNAFVTINGAVVTWSESLAALQTSKTPIRDAITSWQTMLTTVTGAVTRVPSDFYAMLGIPASSGPPQSLIGGSGTLDARKVNAPIGGTLVGPHPGEATRPLAPAHSGSLFGTMAPRPVQGKVATTDTVQPLSVSGTVPLTTAAAPASAKSIFEHVIEAVLVPASLTALAAVALPGVAALLIVAAAGIRVGYRQAKAAVALRVSGIARFAGPGPLGVVRSGSMVALRQRARGPRTKRAVCPEAERVARSHERVA